MLHQRFNMFERYDAGSLLDMEDENIRGVTTKRFASYCFTED